MKNAVTRACAWVSLALLTYAPQAAAETSIELFAGGTPFVGAPANSVPMRPTAMALAPNGTLYLTDDSSGKVLRFDPATSTITSVPNLPGLLEYRFFSPRALGYSSGALNLYASDREVWQLDLTDGIRAYLGRLTDSNASVTFGPDGSLYFTRWDDHVVFKRTVSGALSVVAGSMNPGFSGDGTTQVLLNNPRGVAIDAAGNVFIADSGNHRVRRRAASSGIVTTVAGTGATAYNGENLLATQTNLSNPTLLSVDGVGNLYIYEADTHRIRKLNAATGRITSFAGNGNYGDPGDGGLAVNAPMLNVADIEIAGNGTLYIADAETFRIRTVDASGIIRRTIGNGTQAFCGEGRPAREACLANPNGVAVDDAGDVYVSDQLNKRIRKISAATGLITTIAGGNESYPDGDGGPATAARFFNGVSGLTVDSARNLYFVAGNRVRKIDAASGIITTIAGTGAFGFAGDGGPALAAQFNQPSRLAIDRAGNLYISDTYNSRVRRIDAASGIITTVAGNGTSTPTLGDGGPATAASVGWPQVLAFDPAGNLYIGDTTHYRIRKVNASTGVITTIAGNGNYGFGGNGGPATAAGIGDRPAFTIDAGGNIYLTSSYELRRIDAQTGIIDQAPSPIWGLYTPEGRGLEYPTDMALGPDNRLYIADGGNNNLVLRVSGLPTLASDVTPPVITPIITGTLGNNGWYRSDVQIRWSITDPDSAITAMDGCADAQVNWDTFSFNFNCRATSSGGTTSASVTIKRDTTPPTLTFGNPTPAPGPNGWSSGDVSIPFTTTDADSGVYSTSSANPLTFSGEGGNLTQRVTVTDFAGNSATFTSPGVNIDRTAPVITPSVVGTEGSAGWYRSDVQVTWNIDDVASLTSSQGCGATSITEDTRGTTLTCTATSTGGTTSSSIVIRRDATPPTLTFGLVEPPADSKGWRTGPINVSFDTSDTTSGVASSSSPNPLTITARGAGVTAQVTVTDVAGNSAAFDTPPYNIDDSPPVITYSLTGTPGANGWYRSDVRLSWQVSDDSDVATDNCGDVVVDVDTSGATFECSARSAGGNSVQSVTLRRDATPPSIVFGALAPAPGANGWNSSDVSVPFSAADATSGVSSTSLPSPLLFTAEGAGQSTAVTLTDGAGNTATYPSPAVNIDRSPPGIQPVIVGTLGNDGWYTSDVSVTWAIDEAAGSILSQTGCGASSVTTDTTSATFGCTVTSGGGTATQSVTLKRDATPPTLQWGAFSPSPNTNGWNKTNVTVPFTRADATSGVAATSAASPLTLSSEGAGVTAQVTVTDNAGNSRTFVSDPRNIDKTPPVVSIISPANGATYGFYQDVVANYGCTDVSLLSCTGPNASGDFVNTRTSGPRTFKVTGKDQVAFTTSVTNSFNVANSFNFEGFLPNVVPPPSPNLVAKGSLVPIRWRLPDGNGGYVTNTASFSSATVQSYSCSGTVVPLNDAATGPAGISFDPTTNVFTYNWQTGASWTGCRKLVVKLKDGNLHELIFKFQ